ncbi:MAG: PorT family protein [Segetibacter sp.]|nr:PorT family protein [Segetibacter sp.]
MKKQILLLIAITISTLTMAQLKPAFGVRGGVSSANMRGDAVNSLGNILDFTNGMITTGNRTGFFAGGYAAIPLGDVMSVEPALYYSQKGYELKGALDVKGMGFLGANAKARLNAQYIDIPVLLKANINGFQVFTGPQVSYLMDAGLRTTAGVFGINLLNTKLDATSQFNRLDAGITGGIGYQFTNGLNVMASYDHGLTKVDANRSLNSYNRSFKVGIGMSL